MKILFLGQFPSTKTIVDSNGKIDSLYRDSAALIAGLNKLDGVELSVVTSPDVVSFPKGKFYFNSFYDQTDHAYSVSNLNLPIIKQIWTAISMVMAVIRNAPPKGSFSVIIPYMVFRHVLTTRILKLIYGKRIIVCTIIPDIFFPVQRIVRFVNKITERMAKKSDCFVLYTEKMADYLKLDRQKCVTIEGFKNIPERQACPTDTNFKVVYTGSLEKKYGLLRLLESIPLVDNSSIEFHIYGDGDAVDKIKEASVVYPNLHFHGRVPKNVALDAIYEASCLINPRNSHDGEFVEYSFPSKDIEYLGTGVPVVLCKLPGMPVAYYGHFIDAGEGTPSEIAASINTVYNMTLEERRILGQGAQVFVKDRMNITKQASRLIDLIMRTKI